MMKKSLHTLARSYLLNVAVAEEETGSSDIDSGGDLESFAMKDEIPRVEVVL
jgi:hypothetical protein